MQQSSIHSIGKLYELMFSVLIGLYLRDSELKQLSITKIKILSKK